jgi:hypothetical protein
MLAAGGLAVAGIGFVVAMKLGLIGGGADPGSGTQPPPVIDDGGGTKTPPPVTGSTGQRRGGGGSGGVSPVPPPVTGGTGSRDTTPPVSAITTEEVSALSKAVEAIDPDSPNNSAVTNLLAHASRLLTRAQGPARAEVLMERGTLYWIAKRKIEACKDFNAARDLVSRATTSRISIYYDTAQVDGACNYDR